MGSYYLLSPHYPDSPGFAAVQGGVDTMINVGDETLAILAGVTGDVIFI